MSAVQVDLQIESTAQDLPELSQLELWVSKAIQAQTKASAPELTVRIVDEEESQALNSEYRGKDKPTNVLSFPFEAPEFVEIELLGDLIVCAPVVAKESQQQGKALEAHWAHMIIHGTLHLQGYDHIDEQEAEEMEGLEISILHDLGYTNPYL